jgi:RNA 3'-terminal phosphate cyclase
MCANQPEVTLLPQRVLRLDYPAKPNAHTATADLIAMAMAHLMDGEVYAVLSTEWGYLPEGGWYVLATVADPPEEMLTEEAMRTLGVTPFLN